MRVRDDGTRFDPARSQVVARDVFTEEYVNPDGTRTTRMSAEPLNVRGADGRWHAVDPALVEDRQSGDLRARRHPLRPVLSRHAGEGLLSVVVDGERVSLGMADTSRAEARVRDRAVTYPNALPDTDLEYEVTAGSVKEVIRLRKPGAAAWRFTLDAGSLTPQPAPDGGLHLVDRRGARKLVLPPIVAWDSAGDDTTPAAQTGGQYVVTRDGDRWALTVSVAKDWLHAPERVYPVSVDPTVAFPDDISYSYKSDGAECQNCGLQIGNPLHNGAVWRSAFHFNYSSLWGRTVVGARLDLANSRTPVGVDKTYPAQLHHATAFNFDGVGVELGEGLIGQVGSFSDERFTSYLRTAVANRDLRPYFMLIGDEQPNVWTYKNMVTTLYVDTGAAPPAANRVAPADNSVLTSLTPTLQVNPVTDADGEAVRYCFTVATGADAKSGVVVDSGCLATPTWTVPAGVLQDGVSYTWRASTASGVVLTAPTWIGRFRVDQRIGDRGPSPVDDVGDVEVNLANGNVTTSTATPTFNTVGGSAGLTFAYNSQQRLPAGLRASYFTDLSHTGNIADGQQPTLVRTEPNVNVDWATGSPHAPALAADWFVVRWEGFFQAPAAGSYQFAGAHDDGLKVWVNNAAVYAVPNPSDVNWSQATGVTLAAGQRVAIKVELAEKTATAMARLFVRTTDGTTVPPQIVPAGWLSTTDSPSLPQGWTLSSDLDGSGATYTTAQITDQTVVVTDATGGKHTYTKTSTGGYTAPAGEDGILALDSVGRVTLTEAEDVYVFRADGALETMANVADSRKPAALRNIYDGTPSRLRRIADPVSGREHVLHYNRPGDTCYGTTPVPQGFDALPPGQMLCRIAYWDGTETRLWYDDGQLARVEDPGAEVTDYAYYPQGPLSGVRDNLAADWVAVDPVGRGGTTDTMTVVAYDSPGALKPKATSITEPAPAPGQPRPKHTYRHDPANRQTFTDVAGLAPATGFFNKVVYDDADRLLSTTDATGRTTTQTWNVKDQLLASTDAAGRVSTTVYDQADRVVDTYGPAPASCFAGQLPTAACAATVPREHTDYDEGLTGLSVAWYDNAALTGAPKVYTTGVGNADGSLVRTWPAAPTTGVPGTNWSARFTGELRLPDVGAYRFVPWATDGLRLWIDDILVVDGWSDAPTATKRTGTFTNTTAGAVHRVRMDFYNRNGNALLHLNWARPGLAEENIPGQYLKPRYGLTTRTTEYESGGVPDQVSATRYGENGLDAAYAMPTSTVADPDGTNLVGRTAYETVGTGYLRTVDKTMPTGAVTTYQSYGDTETRANPCVAGSPAVNQGGLSRSSTSPTPASGPVRTDEEVYDASGRVVAEGTAGDWSCTTYDARDRIVRQTYPASTGSGARTVTTDHAVGGDPLTTAVTDHNGTVTTKVDLLGRTVAYTDAQGVRTATTYDQAGRIATERVEPPNPTDPAQVTTYTHDDAGRVLTTTLGTTLLATTTYDVAGDIASVTYANGTALSAVGKDAAGHVTSLTWRTADGQNVVAAVTRTRAGTIVDETLGGVDARPGAPNYIYDGAGRLTEAWVTGHHYVYDHTSAASSACPAGTQAAAGANTNRVRLADHTATGTATTSYCYDNADRLLASIGAGAVSGIEYDDHGNTLRYTAGADTVHLGWDGDDRNVSAASVGADRATVHYQRDASDRIIRRTAAEGDMVDDVRYGYTGDGDTADFVMDADKKILSRTVALPGGVMYTTGVGAGGQPTWDHATIRGDLVLTTDTGGRQVGSLRTYSPYGDPLGADGTPNPDAVPDNQPGQMDYGWLGKHQRHYEHAGALSLVQMGARPYSPLLGRFLTVDPEEGGSANDYDYVAADPINTTDLDGESLWGWIKRTAKRAVKAVGRGLAAAGRWAWRNKWEIASFAPGIGWGIRAARAVRWGYKLYKSSRARGASNCLKNSFTLSTPVLMADGSQRPIGDVDVGDLVLATDPGTGVTRAEPVTDIIVGDGVKDLVDITVDTNGDGAAGGVTATGGHPFYVDSRGWTDAAELRPDDILRTPAGQARVTSVWHRQESTTVRNLTIGWLHTYYVGVDGDSVLTHNCAKKRKAKSKNADRRGHQTSKSKSKWDKHTKAQRHGGKKRFDNPNKRQKPKRKKK